MAIKDDIFALFEGGNSWTKGTSARDADGLPCPILSSRAVSWDLIGALIKANHTEGNTDFTALNAAYADLCTMIPPSFKSKDVEAYNDVAEWDDIDAFFNPTDEDQGEDGSP